MVIAVVAAVAVVVVVVVVVATVVVVIVVVVVIIAISYTLHTGLVLLLLVALSIVVVLHHAIIIGTIDAIHLFVGFPARPVGVGHFGVAHSVGGAVPLFVQESFVATRWIVVEGATVVVSIVAVVVIGITIAVVSIIIVVIVRVRAGVGGAQFSGYVVVAIVSPITFASNHIQLGGTGRGGLVVGDKGLA